MLTAIVISFAMTAVLLVIALRTRADTGSDHVDGAEPGAALAERQARPAPEHAAPSSKRGPA